MDPFVYENFDRNVKNVIKKFPELDTSEANARFVYVPVMQK